MFISDLSLGALLGIITSAIAIITAGIATVKFLWSKSSFSKRLAKRLKTIELMTTQDKSTNSCVLDFTFQNLGTTEILLTELTLEVIDIGRDAVKGFLHASHTYELDISDLEQIGDVARIPLKQIVPPGGKHERFKVRLVAKELGLGRFTAWRLKPILYSESQSIECEIVEIWLPKPSGASFDDARSMELAEETGPIQALINNQLELNRELTEETRTEIHKLLEHAEESLSKRDTREWRKRMAVVLKNLYIEDDIDPILRARFSYPYRSTKKHSEPSAQEHAKSTSSPTMGQQTESHESQTRDQKQQEPKGASLVEQALSASDLNEIGFVLHIDDSSQQNSLDDFIKSLEFTDKVQQLIMDESDLETVALFLEELNTINQQSAEDILKLNGFYTLILPHNLNAGTNVRKIALLIKCILSVNRDSGLHILHESEFDHSEFIRKINAEPDIGEIALCFDWLFYNDPGFAQMISESSELDLVALAHKISKETDPDKIRDVKSAINICSKTVLAKIEQELSKAD